MADTGIQRSYTPDEVELALTQLAVCGGRARIAAQRLQDGDPPLTVPEATLRYWKSVSHKQHYNEIAEKRAPEVEKGIVAQVRETALHALEVQQEALSAQARAFEQGDVKDPSAVARNASVVMGVNLDHMLNLTNRPRMIVQHRSASEILRGLRQKYDVDGEAEEISEAEVVGDEASASGAVPAISADSTDKRAG